MANLSAEEPDALMHARPGPWEPWRVTARATQPSDTPTSLEWVPLVLWGHDQLCADAPCSHLNNRHPRAVSAYLQHVRLFARALRRFRAVPGLEDPQGWTAASSPATCPRCRSGTPPAGNGTSSAPAGWTTTARTS